MIYRSSRSKTAVNYALAVGWGAWSELGVSGWARTHQRWAIDPEPLIIYTAALGDRDPRLRDEVTDWCVRYNRYVSSVRLRNLLGPQKDRIKDEWGEFAATVKARAGVRWPGATSQRLDYRVTGRSALRDLTEPSLVCLRMKAMFGVGARTEILRYLLLGHGKQASVVALASGTSYLKRIIGDECETLERAGVLSLKVVSNRFYYSLARRRELKAFVGALPPICPNWAALTRVMLTLVQLEEAATSLPQRALVVEARQALREIEDDLDTLGIPGPAATHGGALASAMNQWTEETLSELAAGDWPGIPARGRET
jgi:hypothetical protein